MLVTRSFISNVASDIGNYLSIDLFLLDQRCKWLGLFAFVFLRHPSLNMEPRGQRAHYVILCFGASVSIQATCAAGACTFQLKSMHFKFDPYLKHSERRALHASLI